LRTPWEGCSDSVYALVPSGVVCLFPSFSEGTAVLTLKRLIRLSLASAAALVLAAPALAVPVTYGATGGFIQVVATQGLDNAIVFDQTLDLSTDSFLTYDAAGVPTTFGSGTIDDFLLRTIPNQGGFATEIPYGPYDTVEVVMADIFPDLVAGYATLINFGGSFQSSSVAIDATYNASHSSGTPPPSGPTAADIASITPLSGNLTFGPGASTVNLSTLQLIMGTIDGTPFGEAGNDLTLTANITLFASSSVTPTPEPGTAITVGLGLLGIAVQRRRQRNR